MLPWISPRSDTKSPRSFFLDLFFLSLSLTLHIFSLYLLLFFCVPSAAAAAAAATTTALLLLLCQFYTFGMPRVGNDALRLYFQSQLASAAPFRLTHDHDPVPHLPAESWGFHHPKTEVTGPRGATGQCVG